MAAAALASYWRICRGAGIDLTLWRWLLAVGWSMLMLRFSAQLAFGLGPAAAVRQLSLIGLSLLAAGTVLLSVRVRRRETLQWDRTP